MNQYHVYQTKDGEYKAVNTTGCSSLEEVEELLPPHVNWCEASASSPEEAISVVIEDGGVDYRDPELIVNLEREASVVQPSVQGYILYRPGPKYMYRKYTRDNSGYDYRHPVI